VSERAAITRVSDHKAGCHGLGLAASPVTLWAYERRCTAACGAWKRAFEAETARLLRDAALAAVEPFCVCGRVVSMCDRSRRGCGERGAA
jgi:hypothetical protein